MREEGLDGLARGHFEKFLQNGIKSLVQLGAKKFQNPGIVVCGPPFAVLWSCFGLKALVAAVRCTQSNP